MSSKNPRHQFLDIKIERDSTMLRTQLKTIKTMYTNSMLQNTREKTRFFFLFGRRAEGQRSKDGMKKGKS